MKLRALVSVVVATLPSLMGCASGPPGTMLLFPEPPALMPSTRLSYQAESMAVVVPPSADGAPWPNGCPAAGRAFVGFGDFETPGRGTGLVYTESLACLGAPGCARDVPRAHLAADHRRAEGSRRSVPRGARHRRIDLAPRDAARRRG